MVLASAPIVEQLANLFEATGVAWVLWTLIGLSVLSVALMIERGVYFATHSLGASADALMRHLSAGELEAAARLVGDRQGLEAEAVRQALRAAPRGPEAVEEMVQAVVARERLRYERLLSFLGTLGNNAPFLGLFGTVLGIIQAFAELARHAGAGTVTSGSSTIMSGISEALVATAVGLIVALPAVAAYNVFNRYLRAMVSRTEAMTHALGSHLKSLPADEPRAAAPAVRAAER